MKIRLILPVLLLLANINMLAENTSLHFTDINRLLAQDHLIPRSGIFSQTDITQVQLSPDGKHVGYMSKGQLWICWVNSPGKPLIITTEHPVKNWKWTADNQLLTILSNNDQEELWHIDLEDDNRSDLTPFSAQKNPNSCQQPLAFQNDIGKISGKRRRKKRHL